MYTRSRSLSLCNTLISDTVLYSAAGGGALGDTSLVRYTQNRKRENVSVCFVCRRSTVQYGYFFSGRSFWSDRQAAAAAAAAAADVDIVSTVFLVSLAFFFSKILTLAPKWVDMPCEADCIKGQLSFSGSAKLLWPFSFLAQMCFHLFLLLSLVIGALFSQ